MSLTEELLVKLKQQVNAVEFDSDDLLLTTNLKRALQSVLSSCQLRLSDIIEKAESMDEIELECGLPADFAGAVLELAAAMYRYGEAYSESNYRFTPAFEMALSRWRNHYDPFECNDESEGL